MLKTIKRVLTVFLIITYVGFIGLVAPLDSLGTTPLLRSVLLGLCASLAVLGFYGLFLSAHVRDLIEQGQRDKAADIAAAAYHADADWREMMRAPRIAAILAAIVAVHLAFWIVVGLLVSGGDIRWTLSLWPDFLPLIVIGPAAFFGAGWLFVLWARFRVTRIAARPVAVDHRQLP